MYNNYYLITGYNKWHYPRNFLKARVVVSKNDKLLMYYYNNQVG